MQVDVPQMIETYEDNMDQQMDKAMDFEREINEIITRYEIQCANLERQSNETEGYNTHSEGSGHDRGQDRRTSNDTGMPDISRLNLNIPIPNYPPPPRPSPSDGCLLYTSPSPRDRG